MAAQHDRFDYTPVVETAIEADTTVSQPANIVALNRAMIIVGILIVTAIIGLIYAIAPTVVRAPFGGPAEMDYTRIIWLTDRPWLIAMAVVAGIAGIAKLIAHYDERFRAEVVGLVCTVVQPIGWCARIMITHAKIIVLFAGGIILLGLVYIGVQRKVVADGEQAKVALAAQQALTSTNRSDWRRWHLDGLTAEANPGSLELVTAGSVRWVPDTRAPGAEYTSKFELDGTHALFGLFDKQNLMRCDGKRYIEDGAFGQPSAKAMWGNTPEDMLVFSGVAMTAIFHYTSGGAAMMLPINVYHADGTGNEVWAVGDNCSAYRLRQGETKWQDMSPKPKLGIPLEKVAAFGSGDAVASGPTGTMVVWDHGKSLEGCGPSTNSLSDLWGSGLEDVYAIADGTTFHSADRCRTWQRVRDQRCREGQFRLADRRVQRRAEKQTYISQGSATRTFTADQSVRWQNAVIEPPMVASVLYSTDGRTWQTSASALAPSAQLTVRIKMTAKDRHHTPALESFAIRHQ